MFFQILILENFGGYGIWTTIIMAICVFYITHFYMNLHNYPPGPLPLPIIGNVLMFRNYKKHWNLEITKLIKIYGPVITVWIGPIPFIFIGGVEARDTFNKSEISGRPPSQLGSIFCNDKHQDIIFNDYGRSWESLRRISHATIRKFARTEHLEHLCDHFVNNTINLIKEREGINKPFDPRIYLYNLFANIIGATVFSQNFNIEDNELKKFKYCTTDFNVELGINLYLYEFISVLRLFMKNPLIKYRQYFSDIMNYAKNVYQSHHSTYNKSVKRDFCDILIGAKHEAIDDDKQTAPYFTDNNLSTAMIEIFMAGTETSATTCQWMLLFMAYYPELLEKLRNEIIELQGYEVPVIADKTKLNYTMAYIYEMLRFRNPVPLGIFHKTMVNMKIDSGFTIPVNTNVVLHQYCILMDEKSWSDPHLFKPERFLNNDGVLLNTKPNAFIPFSYGRRVCPGEDLAINDLFLILVRFIQLTIDYDIVLCNDNPTDDDLDPNPETLLLQLPKPFEIMLKTKTI